MSQEEDSNRCSRRLRHACINCRRKKVRCCGEQPACSFCVRLGQECRYAYQNVPEPPSDGRLSDAAQAPFHSHYHHLASRISQLESKLKTFDNGSTVHVVDPQYLAAARLLAEYPQGLYPGVGPLNNFNLNIESSSRQETPNLPSLHVQCSAIDAYFRHSHNQPYCFFNEEDFRTRFANGILPEYITNAVLSTSLRFLHDYSDNLSAMAEGCADKAWKTVISLLFESDGGPNYRLVQATTLLAIFDFTACKHGAAWVKIGLAVSLSQALEMTDEPSLTLPCAAREERRRTLWSIYLLDKMASCGRRRPSLFMDRNCNLQLPSSDYAFRTSTEEMVPSLNDLKASEDWSVYAIDSSARTVVVASVLSEIAGYTLHQSKSSGQKPPWDHNSEYPAICTQLSRLENMFEEFQQLQAQIRKMSSPSAKDSASLTDAFLFSYIIYQLCYCLLHHPFLLRRIRGQNTTKIPLSYLAQAITSCRIHAQELTTTLFNARKSGFAIGASFYGYCLLVAGTAQALFQHSKDETIRQQSIQALGSTLVLIAEKAKIWGNSACMESALKNFLAESHLYHQLIDPSCQTIAYVEAERHLLLLDYGAMSEIGKYGSGDQDFEAPIPHRFEHYPPYDFDNATYQPEIIPFNSFADMQSLNMNESTE